jgi:hypothetical protein
MGTHSARSRTARGRWWGLVLAALVIVFLAAATPGLAAPPPTLDLDGLQDELTAHGSVDGVMKTSMSGTTVSDIPVRILAIVDGFYWGKLIMFESTDPAIIDIGGIAAGMSGSPIYVNVDGTERMIGAVSYGDWFTLRGTGLATPIEYMTALQDQYAAAQSAPAAAVRLDRPVTTSAGVVRRLVLGDADTTAAAATAVMHPLAVARIAGLSNGSTAYRKLASKLEESGLTVLAGDTTAGAAVTPALAAGSPCGVVFSAGHYAISVLGTATYVDGDTALLFGHPVLGGYGMALGLGPIEGRLTGATVDAVWPSTYTPYKMMTPADAKGMAVQDRSAGMVGRLFGSMATFPVTTHGSVDGGAPVDDATDLGHWFATTYYPGITTYTAAAGLYHALDSDPLVGSATTTTTVVVGDGTGDYTITRDNIWDNNSDDTWQGLADAAAGDVNTIMAEVLTDPYGVRDVQVKSVDVTADFSSTRRYAGIVDATIARAIRPGRNEVEVTYYRHGSTDPQTMRATLDVPSGTSLSGYVAVMSAAARSYSSDYYYGGGDAAAPVTLAETKEIIDNLPANGDVFVAYIPYSSGEEDGDDDYYGPTPAAETIVPGTLVFSGGVEKDTATVIARSKGTADIGEPLPLSGYVRRASHDVPVAIYCQEAGKPEPTEPTITVMADQDDGMAMFSGLLPGFRHNVLITAEVGALSDDSLPGADQLTVKVRARAGLAVRRSGRRMRMTATVKPADAKGDVVFQRFLHGRWVTAASAPVKSGKAQATIATGGAAKVRVRFAGGESNAASAWVVKALR